MAVSAALVKGPIRKYDIGKAIFHEGDYGTAMYFVLSGKIRISKKAGKRDSTIAIIGPGEFFGEMALIDLSTRSASAYAEDDNTQLIELDRNKFLELVGSPDFSLIIMQTLTARIRDRLRMFEEVKREEVTQKGGNLEIEIKWPSLDEMTTALKVVLGQVKKEKTDAEAKIVLNVREFVLPYLQKLKMSNLSAQQLDYVSVIEENLNNIIAPFLEHLSLEGFKLTPTEMQIANLIKDGKITKQIADLLNLSTATVDFHRNNIRLKLGLTNKKETLKAFLQRLSRNH